ncbi:MAG TPA: lipocalin-like domain-containing protein [Candidatus Limnocylindria bacterium]|nr:lipocalin-like domain-containing protein [Candidatus Limnocylindria bacterium]
MAQAKSLARFLVLVFLYWFRCRAADPIEWMTEEGFAIPRPGTKFNFPRDHGSHPDFAIEWWYVTGHLFESNGVHHGFQVTFFRKSAQRLAAGGGVPEGTTFFGLEQLYLGHTALLDGTTRRFMSQERLNRAGWDANASLEGLEVHNGNWSLRASNTGSDSMELKGSIRNEARFALSLTPRKPLVIFGTNGVSRKAREPSAASHYLTYSRLLVEGTLRVGNRDTRVTGLAWMDHEFSSSQLGSDQVGWDWACLQLKDGREVMAYRMRRADGTTDPFSTLAWIDAAGLVLHASSSEFTWSPIGHWRSPSSGADYPAEVTITCRDPATGVSRSLRLKPLAPNQELDGGLGGIPYWEGACQVLDESGTEIGQSFLELTGYAGSMKGRL